MRPPAWGWSANCERPGASRRRGASRTHSSACASGRDRLDTGWRIGDALALERNDVDFRAGAVFHRNGEP